jgi:hypothetical protein
MKLTKPSIKKEYKQCHKGKKIARRYTIKLTNFSKNQKRGEKGL